MSTLAWIFILAAVVLIRAVAKGRALNLPQDLSDAFQSLIRGDYDDLAESLNRSGDSGTYAFGAEVGAAVTGPAFGDLNQAQRDANTNVAYWAYKLGEAAKGYRWGSAGPSYYDCSGLMYRAVQKVGYKGYRFFTANVERAPGMTRLEATPHNAVVAGDLVVWPGHHMGVVVGGGKFYSALNPRAGIAEREIQGFRKGESPIYLRFVPGSK